MGADLFLLQFHTDGLLAGQFSRSCIRLTVACIQHPLAAALIIHRTTLTYRLGKILELTHLNLDNANLRMYLLLSFQLLDQDGNRDFIRN